MTEPNSKDTLEKAFEKWSNQGRTEEQIWSVQNFLTGAGGGAIIQLIQANSIEAVYRERENMLLRLKQAPPIDWLDAQTWIDGELKRLHELNERQL